MLWWGWQQVVTASALAALVLVAAVAFRGGMSQAPVSPAPAAGITAFPPAVDEIAFDDDPALVALAELTADLDWEAAAEAGLAPPAGAVDRIVTALNDEERLELQRLLEEALSGA